MPTSLWAIALVVASTILGAFAALLLKLGAKKLSFNLKSILMNYRLMLGFLLYGLTYVLLIVALKGGDLSVIYPIVSLGYIWISILSMTILKESMNMWKWTGIIFIVIGASIIGIS